MAGQESAPGRRKTQSVSIQDAGIRLSVSKRQIDLFHKYQVDLVIEPELADAASFGFHG